MREDAFIANMKLKRLLFVLLLTIIAAPPLVADAPPHASYLPFQIQSTYLPAQPHPLLFAFLPDGLAANDADEFFAIQNAGRNPLRLGGWQISDGEGTITLPELNLAPGDILWCARQALAFRTWWGFAPACEYESDSDPTVPNATGKALALSNSGDEINLLGPGGQSYDAVLFGNSSANLPGWRGAPIAYYQRNPRFARAGQVFYRLFDPATVLALNDADAASDWAQGNPDPARGRRAAFAGWDWLDCAQPATVHWETAAPSARLLVAPDNTFAALSTLLTAATTSIHLETYEITHPDLVQVLVARAQAGVEVSVLLEGGPSGGLDNAERWAAQQIVGAGGTVHFMVNDVGDAADRYPYIHAKFAIIDGHTLLVSTENFNPDSFPPDASDGDTRGRRGYALILSDPALVARAQAIFAQDNDLAHPDIFPWQADHPTYGAPPPGYTPPALPDETGYTVRYTDALALTELKQATLFTSPESSLTPGPLLDLIARAGPGDVVLTQQLYEHPFWGGNGASPATDPNPRLEALIAAARRGAKVRLFLDDFFDNSNDLRSNVATVAYVNQLAHNEGLAMLARAGNPTGEGVHAKLHLLALGAERWVVLGSINGGEVSNKLNREMALAFQSVQAYDYLTSLFEADWRAIPPSPTNRNRRGEDAKVGADLESPHPQIPADPCLPAEQEQGQQGC